MDDDGDNPDDDDSGPTESTMSSIPVRLLNTRGMTDLCVVHREHPLGIHCTGVVSDKRVQGECRTQSTLQNRTGAEQDRGRTGLDRTGQDRTGLDWTGLDWTGLDRTGLDWTGQDWTGLDWIG